MPNVADELSRLAALRDQGVLTPEEFEAQKARVLAGEQAATPGKPKRSIAKIGLGCGVLLVVLFVLAMIGAISSGGEQTSAGGADSPKADPAKTEEAPGIGLFGPQANAARSARQYLDMTGFSRRGLIEQLSSEAGSGYDRADATAAVDSLNADWNEQAVRSAKQYLEMTGFSCSGLVEQLSSDAGSKYTKAQARYGATQAGAC